MEIIFELLFQLIIEVVGEALFEGLFRLLGRSAKATHADLLGQGEPSWPWRITSYAILVAVATGLGLWRGSAADGSLTFGFWSAVGAAVACGVALIAAPTASPVPPADPMHRVLRWWPRSRLAWFATGNLVFAVAYLGTA